MITSMLLYLQNEGYTENECGYCLDNNLYVVIFTERRISRRMSVVTALRITSMLLYLQNEGYHGE